MMQEVREAMYAIVLGLIFGLVFVGLPALLANI